MSVTNPDNKSECPFNPLLSKDGAATTYEKFLCPVCGHKHWRYHIYSYKSGGALARLYEWKEFILHPYRERGEK